MKQFITIICCLILGITANAQSFTKEGKTYKIEKTVSQSVEKNSGFTYEDSKGNSYPIFVGKTGSCYIKKISKKTGNEYRYYLGPEISQDICNQLGIKYNPSKKQ